MDPQIGATADPDSYTVMIEKGINEEVAQELNKICQAGNFSSVLQSRLIFSSCQPT